MIYNHERMAVWDWTEGEDSRCPDCDSPLIARMGDHVVWHWAHKAHPSSRLGCSHEESRWHLAMKMACLGLPGWEVEVPVVAMGENYCADAMNRTTGQIREFVHSLSPYYASKHFHLMKSRLAVLWIFDGGQFASERAKPCRGGGLRRLMKPKALRLHDTVGGLLHHEGRLWKQWKDNVWYPVDGSAYRELLERFDQATNDAGTQGSVGTGTSTRIPAKQQKQKEP